MYNMPLAPHEIDALPISERILATIQLAEENIEIGMQEDVDAANSEATDLERAVDDLYEELNGLIDAIDSKDLARIEQAVVFAKNALERNKP